MTPKPLLILVSLALLSGSLAIAQQVTSDPGLPPPPPAGGSAGPKGPRGPNTMHGMRVVNIDRGMRPESRIAPPGIWWKNPDIIQKLTLTADQQKRMDDIFQQSRIQLIDLKANVEKQEVTLEPMLDSNPPDTNKVLTQIDHVAQARAELEKANARMLLGIRGVLSADQWIKLQAEERGNRRVNFKYKFRPDGPDGPEGMLMPSGPGDRSEIHEMILSSDIEMGKAISPPSE